MYKNKFTKFIKSKNDLKENVKRNTISFKDIKLQTNVIVISICITVLAIIGASYAAFVWDSTSQKNQVLTVGTYSIEIDDSSQDLGGIINLASAYPMSDNDGINTTGYKFKLKNNGNVLANFTLKLGDDQTIINSDGCTNNLISREHIKFNVSGSKTIDANILSNLTDNIIDSGILNPGETKTYELKLWISDTAPNDVITQHFHGKLELLTEQILPNLKPNEPVLAEGMIPVIYNDTDDVWEVANKNTEWYNYSKQMWANAVTTSVASYRTATPGTPIPMDDINTMWVWIPRFKYKIPSNIGSSGNVNAPPEIDVIFESGTEATGVSETVYRNGITDDGTNINYYTHPAFRNIDNIEYDSSTQSRGAWDEEITGFWVGKFETGGTTDTPLIKPDVVSLNSGNVSTRFLTSLKIGNGTMDSTTGEVIFSVDENNIFGLNTTKNTVDTHTTKNTEWGAVAILSQSQYGKMGNDNYSGTYKETYPNNSYDTNTKEIYTGRSKGTATSAGYKEYGSYSYNDKTCTTTSPICTGSKVKNKGTGASTTGTIYGVYDMNAGSEDATMGNWANYSGYSSYSNSGFIGINGPTSGGISFPESKYYDLYNGIDATSVSETITKEKSILGDATWETINWYKDVMYTVSSNYPWVARGGHYNDTGGGIFRMNRYNGASGSGTAIGFRTTLIP